MDGIVLPGIDTPAPAAPAAPAPAPESGGEPSSAPSASVEPAPAPEPAPEPSPASGEPAPAEPGDGKKRDRSFQGRISELVGRNRETEARLQQQEAYNRQLMQAFLSQVRQPQQAPVQEQPPSPQDPKYQGKTWGDFYSDLAAYHSRINSQRAVIEYDNWLRSQFQNFAAQQQQLNTEQTAHQVIGQDMSAAVARYPDYVETIAQSAADIPPRVAEAIASSGAPGDVAYYLAKNEALIPRLSQLPDMQLRQAMGRIALFQRTQPPAQSNAPAPGRPAGAARAAPVAYSKDMSPEEHAKLFDPMGRRRK